MEGTLPKAGLGVIPTPGAVARDRRVAWTEALGTNWRVILVIDLALAFLLAALMPLDDIDLPMHLAIGQWIVHHHTVPFTEPFAWTRVGAPYFAYSWLIEMSAYVLLAVAGPIGLHLLYGLIAAAAVVAVAILGRLEGWQPWPTLLTAALHFVVLTRITPSLRPQVALYALVPLAWAAVVWLRRSARVTGPMLALFVVSAIAANTHLLFVLTAAPVFVLVIDPPAQRRRALYAVVAVLVGWLCSPYGVAWPAVFRLNFAPNLLFTFPSPIVEYQPGFNGNPILGAFLAILPWLLWTGRRATRRDVALGILWLVGLIGFAHAQKAITIWWLVSLPLIGAAVARIPDPRSLAHARVRAGVLAGLGFLLCAEHAILGRPLRAQEGTVATRTMPGAWSTMLDPVARWLDTHARPTRRVRLFTTFNYGSYLTWRLPTYSASIDSRTIFPDSVAAPEAVVARPLAGNPLGPWRWADVAIVPNNYAVAAALDTASGWVRLFPADTSRARPGMPALWARRAWWDSVRVREPTSASRQ